MVVDTESPPADIQMDKPLADWSLILDQRLLAARLHSLAHPGRRADEVLRDMLVLIGAVRFSEALRKSQDAAGQGPAREKLTEISVLIEAAVERLAERIRRNDAQRSAICSKMSTLARLAGNEAGWAGAINSYGLHRPLSQVVIRMCQEAQIGVGPDFYQKNLPRAAEQALGWLHQRC